MAAANPDQKLDREVVGLIPAGGRARRIAPLPCSKELYPIGFRSVADGRSVRSKVVSHYLLEKMRLAGINKAYIVLRKGKWDIPSYFGDGSMLGMNLAYLMMGPPFGPAYTLDQAYPFVQNAFVAFGFPDILFQTDDAFVRALNRQAATHADAVLGLLPARQTQEVDMVELQKNGRVRSIVKKPLRTRLRYTWIFAVWTPAFTCFMHQYLAELQNTIQREAAAHQASNPPELSVGEVIQAAIDRELTVDSVLFPDDTYLDIGTPDDLVKAVLRNQLQYQ